MPTTPRFAICVSNEGCDDLDLLKVYRVLPDDRAADDDMIRVIDESGEDYLYPADRFVSVDLPPAERERVAAVSAR